MSHDTKIQLLRNKLCKIKDKEGASSGLLKRWYHWRCERIKNKIKQLKVEQTRDEAIHWALRHDK